jgi:hypothetical protein
VFTESAVPGLAALGWGDGWATGLAELADPTLRPGRLSRVDRGLSTVMTATAEVRVGMPHDVSLAVGDLGGRGPVCHDRRPCRDRGHTPTPENFFPDRRPAGVIRAPEDQQRQGVADRRETAGHRPPWSRQAAYGDLCRVDQRPRHLPQKPLDHRLGR